MPHYYPPNTDPLTLPPRMPETPAPNGQYWAINPISNQWALFPVNGYMGDVYRHGATLPQRRMLEAQQSNVNSQNNTSNFFTQNKGLTFIGIGLAAWYFLGKK